MNNEEKRNTRIEFLSNFGILIEAGYSNILHPDFSHHTIAPTILKAVNKDSYFDCIINFKDKHTGEFIAGGTASFPSSEVCGYRFKVILEKFYPQDEITQEERNALKEIDLIEDSKVFYRYP